MQFRAVAFVLAEAIFGKARAEVAHNRVARDLGNDTGGGNAETEAIAIDNGRLRKRKRKNRKAIDEHMVGPEASASMAARIALWVARRILIASISIESTIPTAQAMALVADQFVIDFFAAFGEKLF